LASKAKGPFVARVVDHISLKSRNQIGLSKEDMRKISELKSKHYNMKFFSKSDLEVVDFISGLHSFEQEKIKVYRGFIHHNYQSCCIFHFSMQDWFSLNVLDRMLT